LLIVISSISSLPFWWRHGLCSSSFWYQTRTLLLTHSIECLIVFNMWTSPASLLTMLHLTQSQIYPQISNIISLALILPLSLLFKILSPSWHWKMTSHLSKFRVYVTSSYKHFSDISQDELLVFAYKLPDFCYVTLYCIYLFLFLSFLYYKFLKV
jgi:hypothetical protein